MAAVPASAGVLYDNGPINGTITARTICCDWEVSNSFNLSGSSTITGVRFGVWTDTGNSPVQVDWWIGTSAFDNSIASGTAASVSSSYWGSYFDLYDIYDSNFSIPNLSLGSGTYYLTLLNAAATSGTIFWDTNQGPSLAFQSTNGAIDSEAFQILGTTGVPEPSSLVLFGSGILLLAGLLRRKLS